MKPMFESAKTFECYATIEGCYFLINKIQENLKREDSPIEIMIDRASGFSQYQAIKEGRFLIQTLKTIISCKKKIEADYSVDEELLNELLKLKLSKKAGK